MRYRRKLIVGSLLSLLASDSILSNDVIWTNDTGNFTWSTTSNNWTGNQPWNNAANNGAVFTSSGTGNLSLIGNITARSLNFQAGSYSISGGTLNLTSAGSSSLAGGEVRVTSPLATISSTIAGTIGLTKTGTGTLVLGGTNTYSGVTNVNEGILALSQTQNSSMGQINVGSGATLRFDRNDVFGTHTSVLAPDIVVNGGTIDSNGNRFNTLQNVTLNNGTIAGMGGGSLLYPSWSFRGTVTSTGTSVISPTGPNAAISLGQDGDTHFNVNSGSLTIASNIIDNQNSLGTGVVAGSLIKNGSGALILNGNNSYTGSTVVNSGVLSVGSLANGGQSSGIGAASNSASNLVLDTDATLRYTGATTTTDRGFTVTSSSAVAIEVTNPNTTLTLTGTSTAPNALNGTSWSKTGPGTLTLTGSNSFSGVSVFISEGTTNITNGGSVVNKLGYIGQNNPATVNVGGGTGNSIWNNSLDLTLGNGSNGVLNITGGGSVVSTNGYIGNTSTGTVTVGGGTGIATWSNSSLLHIGEHGQGTLNITGGGAVSNNAGVIGYYSDSTGSVSIGGGAGASAWNNTNLHVAEFGIGNLNINSGGTVTSSSAAIGQYAGSSGIVTIGGGTWTNSGDLKVGSAGAGILNINSGTVTTASISGGNASSSINFNGGTLKITSSSSSGNQFNLLAGGGTVDIPTAGNAFTITSAVAGTGGLQKAGLGDLVLSAANTYAGPTTIGNGYLVVSLLADGGVPSNLGQSTSAAANLIFNGGALRYTGSTATINRGFTVTSSAGTIDITDPATTLTWSGNSTGNNFGGFFQKKGPGTIAFTGTNQLSAVDAWVNQGDLTITSGGSLSTKNSYIALNLGSNAVANVGGGSGNSSWTGNLHSIGERGTGTLNIIGGGTVGNTNGVIGNAAGAFGTVTVGGGIGTSRWNSTNTLTVGNYGNGVLNITSGSVVTNGDAYVGTNPGSLGAVNVGGETSGAVWINYGTLHIGGKGNGAVNITGGGSVSSSNAVLGYQASGLVTVGGGSGYSSWTNSGPLMIGDQSVGSLNINQGGTVETAQITGGNASSSINLNGGTLRITETHAASNIFNLLSGGGTFDVNSGKTFTVDSAISGVGGLNKTGAGTLLLTNTNSYLGNTSIARGTLQIIDDANLGSGNITVSSLGTLMYMSTTTTSRVIDLNNGSLRAAPGQTLTFNNAAMGGGYLSGSFATLAGSSNSLMGGALTPSGTLALNGDDLVQNYSINGSVIVPATRTSTLANTTVGASGKLLVAGNVNSSDLLSTGFISVTGNGKLTNTGSSPITLGSGSVTQVGSYNPANGHVTSGGTIVIGSQDIVVQGGFLRNNGTITGSGRLVVDYGGIAKGAGDFDVGSTVLLNGGQFLFGNSPGLTRVSNPNFIGASIVGGDLNNATGTVGGFSHASNGDTNNSGWSALEFGNSANTASGLTLQRGAAGPVMWRFRTTLNDTIGDTPGLAANFDPNLAYSWLLFRPRTNASISNPVPTLPSDQLNTVATIILRDTAGIVLPNTFDNLNFVLGFDSSLFANSTYGSFSFSFGSDLIGRSDSVIYLNYSPIAVPEPATWALLGATILGVGGYYWRKKQARELSLKEWSETIH